VAIDWVHFTPGSALAGGLLIGAAAAWLWRIEGRILGATGLLAGLLPPREAGWAWRGAALIGMIAAPALARLIWATPVPTIPLQAPGLILGGLLVGFGTRLANGCTSGHGVCGLARLSPRSLAATLTFMAAGFAVVFLARHVL